MDNILGPESISERALKILRATIDLAAENNMLSQQDAKKALAIIKVNPHRRLGLLGKRLARIQADLTEISAISHGFHKLAEECGKELQLLKHVIEWQPEWRPNGNATMAEDAEVVETPQPPPTQSEEGDPETLNMEEGAGE